MRRRGGQGGEQAGREGDWDCWRRSGGSLKLSHLLGELQWGQASVKLMLHSPHLERVRCIIYTSCTCKNCQALGFKVIDSFGIISSPYLVRKISCHFLTHLKGIDIKNLHVVVLI